MSKEHTYSSTLNWTGNTGLGTASYRSYERAYEVSIEGKPILLGSSDPSFRGDPSRYNPEEMLLASISSCHMLWFLHFCSEAGVVVIAYTDSATATMLEEANGNGRFTEAILRPQVTVSDAAMIPKLDDLHHKANKFCFIANSVKFPVKHQATAGTA